jgi:hypothetical protein
MKAIIKEMREMRIDIIGAASIIAKEATQIMPDGTISIINDDGSFTAITDEQFDAASVLAVTNSKNVNFN